MTQINKPAETAVAIQPLLSRRYSPYRFDPTRDVAQADLQAVFEAARWTMSSYNAQPWRYIVGVKSRSADVWQQIFDVLVEGNQGWAQYAPVLALGMTNSVFTHNGKHNKAATHDLGAASANLTFEATARGISVHQMIGIEPEKATQIFTLPAEIVPLTAMAIGYAGDNPELAAALADRDQQARERMPASEFLMAGSL
ncbi:MAG: nitroreductase family protein [bacterium]